MYYHQVDDRVVKLRIYSLSYAATIAREVEMTDRELSHTIA
jgi:hypothetical protein